MAIVNFLKATWLSLAVLCLLMTHCFGLSQHSTFKGSKHNSHQKTSRLSLNEQKFPDTPKYDDLTKKENLTILVDDGKWVMKEGNFLSSDECVAFSSFGETLDKTGWNTLYIETKDSVDPIRQAWAAGFLEGYQTQKQISQFHGYLRQSIEREWEDLENYYDELTDSLEKKLSKEALEGYKGQTAKFWNGINLAMAQTRGVLSGCNARAEEEHESPLKWTDLLIVNADGELGDLSAALKAKKNSTESFVDSRFRQEEFDPAGLMKQEGVDTPKDLWKKLLLKSHCSLLIKPVTEEGSKKISELYAGHNTWDDFMAMNRFFKTYSFKLNGSDDKDGFETSKLLFSSYPGCISSADDYYLSNHKLWISETTLQILDRSIYQAALSATESVPNFMRIMSATRSAKDGDEWISLMKEVNTGTYNSQWVVLDYNKFEAGSEDLPAGTLIVMEQAPGKIVDGDMTDRMVDQGYWASYNRPFFGEIAEISGYKTTADKFGDVFLTSKNPRAIQFEMLAGTVKDLKSMKLVLRYNPYSQNNSLKSDPASGIAARYDLEDSKHRVPFGAIDAKVTSASLMERLGSVVVAGPTDENLPEFKWSDFPDVEHEGLPERYHFPWVEIEADRLSPDASGLIEDQELAKSFLELEGKVEGSKSEVMGDNMRFSTKSGEATSLQALATQRKAEEKEVIQKSSPLWKMLGLAKTMDEGPI